MPNVANDKAQLDENEAYSDLFEDLQSQVFELHDHAWVVNLELDHSPQQALLDGQILGEFRRQLAVDIEFEAVAIGDDMHIVPIALIDLVYSQSVLDGDDGRFVILRDNQAVAAEATVLFASGRMKVPSA